MDSTLLVGGDVSLNSKLSVISDVSLNGKSKRKGLPPKNSLK
jgi:hypothetical protein